jgi:hypothetical protein
MVDAEPPQQENGDAGEEIFESAEARITVVCGKWLSPFFFYLRLVIFHFFSSTRMTTVTFFDGIRFTD